MRTVSHLLKCTLLLAAAIVVLAACSRKSGCPTNGKNVGAERLMSGEKLPKAKKFRA
ncbi:MAG: hypothetical protein ACO1NW_12480 [Chitinophagaceae bacterium]